MPYIISLVEPSPRNIRSFPIQKERGLTLFHTGRARPRSLSKMRAPVVVFGLLSVIAVLDPIPGVLGHQDGLWARVKRTISNLGGERTEPPYDLYGGPSPEEKAYSYPPYGYPPPPPPEESSSYESEYPSSSGKTLIHLIYR